MPLETLAVPADDGRRRDEVKAVAPAVVYGPEDQPEAPVGLRGARLLGEALEDRKLLAQGQVLEDEAVAPQE